MEYKIEKRETFWKDRVYKPVEVIDKEKNIEILREVHFNLEEELQKMFGSTERKMKRRKGR